jgi:transposase-like protein
MSTQSISYKRHRFRSAIITHAVWLHCRFNLSLREVEEMFPERGTYVSYETVRRWVAKFAPSIAGGLRRRRERRALACRFSSESVKAFIRSSVRVLSLIKARRAMCTP